MIDRRDAQLEVERRQEELNEALQAVEAAKAAAWKAKHRGGLSGHEALRLIKTAESSVRHTGLEADRAREALAEARRVLDLVTANEPIFTRLAAHMKRIEEHEALLGELAADTRSRAETVLAALSAEVNEATVTWRGLPVEAMTNRALTPPHQWSRWASPPFGRDVLAALADGTREAE